MDWWTSKWSVRADSDWGRTRAGTRSWKLARYRVKPHRGLHTCTCMVHSFLHLKSQDKQIYRLLNHSIFEISLDIPYNYHVPYNYTYCYAWRKCYRAFEASRDDKVALGYQCLELDDCVTARLTSHAKIAQKSARVCQRWPSPFEVEHCPSRRITIRAYEECRTCTHVRKTTDEASGYGIRETRESACALPWRTLDRDRIER